MLTRTSIPADLLTLAEIKPHLQITHARDDALLGSLLKAATEWLDGENGVLGQAIVDRTYQWKTGEFLPLMRFPIRPVSLIQSITYLDSNGASQTVPNTAYYLFADALGPYIKPVSGYPWPLAQCRDDAITVNFTAGMGTPGQVPQPLKSAALMIIAHLYHNREVEVSTETFPLGFGMWQLIAPYRRVF